MNNPLPLHELPTLQIGELTYLSERAVNEFPKTYFGERHESGNCPR